MEARGRKRLASDAGVTAGGGFPQGASCDDALRVSPPARPVAFSDALPRDFFARDTLAVAKALLGRFLVRRLGGVWLVARIVETEAYVGRCDRACHAYGGRRTARTEALFAEPGTAYVYFVYGMHHCLNAVTERAGEPAAVLIRGAEPVVGHDTMARRRFGQRFGELSPAR